jgi:hypothetical protein
MIKRLASAPKKKARKTSVALRSKNKKARRIVAGKASNRAGRVEESTLAAEQIFLMYDAAEAKHAKT